MSEGTFCHVGVHIMSCKAECEPEPGLKKLPLVFPTRSKTGCTVKMMGGGERLKEIQYVSCKGYKILRFCMGF